MKIPMTTPAVLLCKSAASYSGANGASVYGYCLYIYMVFIYLYIYRTVTYITSPISPKLDVSSIYLLLVKPTSVVITMCEKKTT